MVMHARTTTGAYGSDCASCSSPRRRLAQLLKAAMPLIALACALSGEALAADTTTNAPAARDSDRASPPSTPREFFNSGTARLRQGKFREAEPLLESALASQDERLQPSSLYNLGHVRFGQGIEA